MKNKKGRENGLKFVYSKEGKSTFGGANAKTHYTLYSISQKDLVFYTSP